MRVRRLKQLLLFGPYVVFLISIILCISLFILVFRENRRIDAMQEEIELLSTNQDGLIEKVSSMGSSVDELSDAVGAIEGGTAAAGSPRTAWPRKVYLTFDDGPSANTGKILDILDEYGVKGNFFVVGTENENLRRMYKRIVDEGHVLCMHSYTHKYNEIYSSVDAFTEDLDKITALIEDVTGKEPAGYRFPGGSSNSVSKIPMKEFIKVLDERGITYYDWNIVSGDATNPMLPKEKIIENSLSDLCEFEEAMILFHDLSNKTSTVEALPEIIEAIQEKGIPIVPIDDETIVIHHYTQ